MSSTGSPALAESGRVNGTFVSGYEDQTTVAERNVEPGGPYSGPYATESGKVNWGL